MLAAGTAEAIHRGVAYVGKVMAKRRLHGPVFDHEDVTQEAALAMVQAAHGYRARASGSSMFFPRVGLRATPPAVNRWRAVTALPRAVARKGFGEQARAESTEIKAATLAPSPAEVLERRQDSARLAVLRIRYRREVDRATAGVCDLGRRLGPMAFGIDGDILSATQIARKTRIDPSDVRYAVRRFRDAVRRSPAVAKVVREMLRLQEQLL